MMKISLPCLLIPLVLVEDQEIQEIQVGQVFVSREKTLGEATSIQNRNLKILIIL
jgi:hypothetical protein